MCIYFCSILLSYLSFIRKFWWNIYDYLVLRCFAVKLDVDTEAMKSSLIVLCQISHYHSVSCGGLPHVWSSSQAGNYIELNIIYLLNKSFLCLVKSKFGSIFEWKYTHLEYWILLFYNWFHKQKALFSLLPTIRSHLPHLTHFYLFV